MTLRRFPLALLLFLLTGCASGGGGTPPPQPTPAPVQAMAVIVHDLERPGQGVEGVAVDCGPGSTGTTNADGYTVFSAYSYRQADCTMSRDGWLTNTASFVPTPEQATLETWIQAAPPPRPVHPDPIVGRVRWDGSCYRDDTGCRVLSYAHAGNLFAVWVRDEARASFELDKVASAGHHGVRSWGTLGCDGGACTNPTAYWYGNDVNPTITPDYPGQMRRFFAALTTRGLRAVWSQGDIRGVPDRRAYMQDVAAADGGTIDWIDGANEAWQTGEPDPNKLADFVGAYAAAGGVALKTLTSPPGEGQDELNRYSIAPADAFDKHGYRGGHCWDKRRHAWGVGYEGVPSIERGIESEPPGGGHRVSVTENKHELDDECVALLALGNALGRSAFVWFSGEGVILDRGLETEAGFWSVPRAMRLLPRDVMTFRTTHHSGASWRGTRVLAAQGDVRIDGRIGDDGRFAYTIDGPGGDHRLAVDRSFTGQVCDPGTGACVDVSKQAGESLDVSFRYGRLLVGRLQ